MTIASLLAFWKPLDVLPHITLKFIFKDIKLYWIRWYSNVFVFEIFQNSWIRSRLISFQRLSTAFYSINTCVGNKPLFGWVKVQNWILGTLVVINIPCIWTKKGQKISYAWLDMLCGKVKLCIIIQLYIIDLI